MRAIRMQINSEGNLSRQKYKLPRNGWKVRENIVAVTREIGNEREAAV